MALAAAEALAAAARKRSLTETSILPRCDDIDVAAEIAAAVGMAAQAEGLAQHQVSRESLYHGALTRIRQAREQNRVLMEARLITPLNEAVPGD